MGYKSQSYENQAKTIIKNLEKRNMKGYYCETGEKALELVKSILPKGALVTNGGSETLVETGIMDLLRSGDYEYIDRQSAKTPEESRALYGKIVTADYFLMSTNAITKERELVNVDGIGNRVACLINLAQPRTGHRRHEQNSPQSGGWHPPGTEYCSSA